MRAHLSSCDRNNEKERTTTRKKSERNRHWKTPKNNYAKSMHASSYTAVSSYAWKHRHKLIHSNIVDFIHEIQRHNKKIGPILSSVCHFLNISKKQQKKMWMNEADDMQICHFTFDASDKKKYKNSSAKSLYPVSSSYCCHSTNQMRLLLCGAQFNFKIVV